MTIMTSIKVKNDVLWSTPIQSRHDSGYGVHDTFGCDIDISPIRKKVSNSCSFTDILKRWDLHNRSDKINSEIKNVSRKLPFIHWGCAKSKTASPKQVDSGIESMCKTNGSGIDFDNSLANSRRQNLHSFLRSFPTDLNSDITKKYVNSNNCKFHQPRKYICKEGLDHYQNSKPSDYYSQPLDKNNNTVDNIPYLRRKPFSTIDFLHELSLRNCASIISQILSYLPDEDLRKVSYVSRQWQNIIFNDEKSNKRRSDYINNRRNVKRGPSKENRFQTKCPTERNHKSVLLGIMNASSEVSKQPLYDNLFGKFDSFCKEVKTLQDKDELMKCPKCNYPSKIETGSKFCCTRNLCLYEFCKKCLGPYMENHFCSEPKLDKELPSIIIGSKKSKKFLRRL